MEPNNRPSIEFHEKGRKHQDNVARRLKTISKQSRRDQKESVRMDTALRKMESAALEAYRKDIENNADMSSRAINETLEKSNLALSSKKIWHEFRPKEGPVYYCNTETKETIWSPPSCGFLSVAEQEAQAFVSGKQQLQDVDKYKKRHDRLKLEENRQQEEEERAAAVREKMKARRVVEEVEEEVPVPGPIIEQPTGPYGNWRTVEAKPKKLVDLQLPKGEEFVALYIPAEKPAPPPRVFKEKTITSLTEEEDTSCATTSFKRRKFPHQKRNVRQRLDNE
ncbi:uncharacterized protein CBL_09796 [Carabus blaptoides fortunei]